MRLAFRERGVKERADRVQRRKRVAIAEKRGA